MSRLVVRLKGEAHTAELAAELALYAQPGMFVCLKGSLGAGKTVFARAFLRALAANEGLEVPSPTFTLVQPYDETRIPVWHVDLYRISAIDEIDELGLFDGAGERVTLLEWPQRIAGMEPSSRIEVLLEGSGEIRDVSLTGHGKEISTIDRIKTVRAFLKSAGWENAQRAFLQGDASARRYERLSSAGGQKAILMDMPSRPDGPPVHDNRTYSSIAHLAEGTRQVEAIAAQLRHCGFCAPQIFAADHAAGLMLTEDLGDEVYSSMLARGDDMEEPMRAAVDVLVAMAACQWPGSVSLADGSRCTIAGYDEAAYEIEVSLLLDWFWPLTRADKPDADVKKAYFAAWREVFPLFAHSREIWVLRDYHSPNLIWQPGNDGVKRVGLIDTQDCIAGHPAYDLVSLLQDARNDLPEGMETRLFEYYCKARSGTGFDITAFHAAYSGLGAQRATKILGIFARLYKRDGKPQYLAHIPRVSAALEKNLAHRALAPVRRWFEEYLPAASRKISGKEAP